MILFGQGSIFDIQTSYQSTYGYTLLILNTRLHGVFPFLWIIREMCCIISMLERNAHMNAYLTHIEVIFLLSHWRIVIIHYKFKERVDKWAHEPWSNFNHKKHLFHCTYLTFYLQHYYNPKIQKIVILFAHKTQKTINHLLFLLSLFYLYSLSYFCYYFILLILIRNLVLDNHTVELRTQDNFCALQVARRGEEEISL
jgi:hypothetical protein